MYSVSSGSVPVSKTRNRELLKKELSQLSQSEFFEIFNIIRSGNYKYSENNNGIFVNLKQLHECTINKIWDFVEFSKQSKVTLMTNEQQKKRIQQTEIRIPSKHKTERNQPRSESFSFKGYLEKLAPASSKQFQESDERIHYPSLKTTKCKFDGVKARLLKKCRDVNRTVIVSESSKPKVTLKKKEVLEEQEQSEEEIVEDDGDEIEEEVNEDDLIME